MAPTSGRTCGRSGGEAIGLRQDGSPEASAMCPGVAKQAQGSHLTQMPQGLYHIQRIEYTFEGDLYFCNVCPRARGAKSWKVHARKPAHQTNLRRRDELRQRTAPAPPQPVSVGDPNPDDSHPQLQEAHQDAAYEQ
ncbi:hypothetical protein PtA15_2A760 [Puccinia triticina]|uniref:U1-type domain-containing protein n=1 Tax=Puccinia triticina TaxID=208348 RepID=A0ABY7CC13_9BASI|nr:uncharacterized protein PtA15_2A760 [Puccinia triticina]WAQ82443.1 hypothetical protein PtA15_2A760 [Puccinia triticina]